MRIMLENRGARLTLLLAIVVGMLVVLTPVTHAQSLFSQNKPEQAQAVRDDARRTAEALTVEREKAIAKRDAAAANGDAATVASLEKAIERFTAAITASNAVATAAGGAATGDPAAEDAGWMTLGGLLPPPFNVIAMLGLPIALREWRAWQQRKAAAAAIAAAKKEAADNEAAAKSIVNMVDQIRIAKPEVAVAMKDLTSRTETNFTTALTPRAQEIIESERLT